MGDRAIQNNNVLHNCETFNINRHCEFNMAKKIPVDDLNVGITHHDVAKCNVGSFFGLRLEVERQMEVRQTLVLSMSQARISFRGIYKSV